MFLRVCRKVKVLFIRTTRNVVVVAVVVVVVVVAVVKDKSINTL